MQLLAVKCALYLWPVVVLVLFSRMRPHRALIVSILAGIMFLPEVQLSQVSQEAPDANDFVVLILKFTKPNAICFAALLGVIVFDSKQLRTFRLRWFDLPMLFWCVLTYFSNRNDDVGVYDSFAMMRDKTLTWGVPYFLGRIYFADLDKFRDLAVGIFLAGLVYAPLCLEESVLYPKSHLTLYGFFPGSENEVFRAGGYRPVGFMSHGLMLGLWMAATAIIGVWLWWTGAIKQLTVWPFPRPIRMTLLAALMVFTAAWVRSMGALLIGIAALLGIAQMRLVKLPVVLVVLLVSSPVFIVFRISGWTGDNLIQFLKEDLELPDERVASQEFRLQQENRLLLTYREKPNLGFGDFTEHWREAPMTKKGDFKRVITDALWAGTLTQYGQLGLAALWLAMLLPVARFMIIHPPRLWFQPALAPAAAVALVLIMYMLDNLSNGFYNTIYVLCAGALSSVAGARLPSPEAVGGEPEPEEDVPPPEPSQLPQFRPGVLTRHRQL